VKDTYDVALVSAGVRQSNMRPYIQSGNSAMYVGGVLQMLFGVLGARWLKDARRGEAVPERTLESPERVRAPRDYKILKTGATSNNKNTINYIFTQYNTIQSNLLI
jgi:hypothetical protein